MNLLSVIGALVGGLRMGFTPAGLLKIALWIYKKF
jgi:hypothetical protein